MAAQEVYTGEIEICNSTKRVSVLIPLDAYDSVSNSLHTDAACGSAHSITDTEPARMKAKGAGE